MTETCEADHVVQRLDEMFERSGATRRSVIATGGAAVLSAALGSLPGSQTASAQVLTGKGSQSDWRFCDRCFTMFYSLPNVVNGFSGHCPAGGAHEAQGFVFSLYFDNDKRQPAAGRDSQFDWRFCSNCFSLFWSGDSNNQGKCNAGGSHVAYGFVFGLPHDNPANAGQDNWRFCGNCRVLFFDDPKNTNKGKCFAGTGPGGGHVRSANSFNFQLPFRPPGVQDKIAAAFRDWLTTNSIVNASLAVTQGGTLIGQFGFGNRQSNTVVAIASLTKAITATCIASLVDAGKLHYTDTVSGQLSTFFASITLGDKRAKDITIEHLLRHTSGLSFDPVAPPWASDITNTASADAAFAKAALAKTLDRVPGTGTNNYNNVNYALLGMVIKQITGQTYEAYCKQTVLAQHRFSDVRIGAGLPALGSFGGWEMSVEQYADFINTHYRKMSTSADAFMQASYTAQYALGVGIKKTSSGRNIWHFGNWPGGKAPFPPTTPSQMSSYFALWDNDLCVVVACDKALNNTQQGTLDKAMVTAAGK